MSVPDSRVMDLHQIVALCSELSGVATADGDLGQIVALVAGRAGVWAAVVDDSLSVLALGGGPEPGEADLLGTALDSDRETVAQLISAAAQMRRALSLPAFGARAVSLVVAPILVGDDAVAYLLTAGHDADETGEDTRIMVTEHAAMVSAVILGRRRVVAIAAGRARRELFDGLVLVGDRTEADIEGWARHLGIEPGHRQRVLLTAVDSPQGAPAPAVTDLVENLIATRCPTATVVNRGAEVVTLVPGDDDEGLARRLTGLAKLCRETVGARFPGIRIVAGLSDSHTGTARISTSYEEARRAVDIGRTFPGLSEVTVFADLGVHRLLAQVRDVAELGRFTRHVLGDLLDYDRANGTGFGETLAVYFRENASPQRAAALLHTHPNTVAYRLRRAAEIAGVDLGSYTDRLAVQLALEILNGLGGDLCATSS
ncbi:PucR family transcriptional regulator [Nocardia miyunensis]|uniref:PucR family transcriptional regulator n=1 Tax=Nocardia miyunensis TaxID=282684 RepID=UPI001471BED9|nr:helix-turn-helix domain-containing protein [Nocardia miyunensis]